MCFVWTVRDVIGLGVIAMIVISFLIFLGIVQYAKIKEKFKKK